MAEVTIRVRLNKDFTVFCDGTNAEECLDNILYYERLDREIMDAVADCATVVDGTYDEPEEEEEEDEDQ